MTFRIKLMLLAATGIALALAVSSGAVWFAAKRQLWGQVDADLRTRAQQVVFGHRDFGPLEPGTAQQVVAPDGSSSVALPVLRPVLALATGKTTIPIFANTTVRSQGVSVDARVYAVSLSNGGALAVWRNVGDTEKSLHRIGLILIVIGAGGVALGVGIAAFVAAAALRPVRRLTVAAERVAATANLEERVDVKGRDELGRLALRFNEMMSKLESSLGAQRRLVADASHELRTPLTAARTNVELVLEARLPPAEAQQALREAATELDALTTLVSDLVELARGAERKLRMEEFQLDELVASVVERTRTRNPAAVFVTALTPSPITADPVLLEHAIANLIDNAIKYSPPTSPIEITVRSGEVIVQDHGPGIAREDLPRIFDRFYRSAAARSKPGSGLGLAIVREAAEAHGGTATAETAAYGARFRLALPASA